MSEPRGVEQRIAWFLDPRNAPTDRGMCARHTWHALGGDQGNPPAWGAPDANAIVSKLRAAGELRTTDLDAPPRGAIVVWRYEAHGHVALSLGDGRIATTDPSNGAMVGIDPITHPARWGAPNGGRPTGWADYYAGVRIPVGGSMAGNFDYWYGGKPTGTLSVGTAYKTLDASAYDPIRKGLEHTLVYLNVTGATGAGLLRIRLLRADNDATAYHDVRIDGPRLVTYTYFELGDGQPSRVQLKCHAGLRGVTIGTRYRKVATLAD